MRTGKRLLAAALLAALPGAAIGAVTYVAGVPGRLVDGSGVIATANTSQQVFDGNSYRAFLSCQNPINATETLFVNLSLPASATGSSFELAPGGSITFGDNFVPTGPVNVSAATAGHRFICKQGGDPR